MVKIINKLQAGKLLREYGPTIGDTFVDVAHKNVIIVAANGLVVFLTNMGQTTPIDSLTEGYLPCDLNIEVVVK